MGKLSSTKKTQITSVETAINTAISGLNPNDESDQAALSTLRHMRKLLEQIKVERVA